MAACRRKLGLFLLVGGCLAATPAMAHADAGIPMMPLPYPDCLWLLPGVMVLEILYVLTAVRIPWLRGILAMISVNAATTGLGFPLAWLVYMGVRQFAGFPGGTEGTFTSMQYVPLWMTMRLFPDSMGTSEQIWLILGTFLLLLVPSYLISRLIKLWVIDWYDLLAFEGDTKAVVFGANRVSHMLLAVLGCAILYRMYHGL